MFDLREFSDEAKLIVQTIDEITNEYDHDYWVECCKSEEFPSELWEELGKHGFLGMNVPKEYGGEDLGLYETSLIHERLQARGIHLSFLVTSATMAPIPIKFYGDDILKKRVLPKIATGEYKISFGLTEPDAGTNSYKISTRAERDGDHYTVNGQKVYTTGAKRADYILLVTRTTPYEEVKDSGKHKGVTLLLVPTDVEGIEMQPLDVAILEEGKQWSVFFSDVQVPARNRIGDEGKGFSYLFDALNPERVITASGSIGAGRFALERAVKYAKGREVWDAPIGSHQAVQHPLTRAMVQLELAALAKDTAARAFDAGDQERARNYANMASFVGSEAGDEAVDAAIQTLGGNGLSRDYGVINVSRIPRFHRIAPISNEMILNNLAEGVLGLPKSY